MSTPIRCLAGRGLVALLAAIIVALGTLAPPLRGQAVKKQTPAPSASAQAAFRGKRWAAVIGISKYQDKDVPSVEFADEDAKSFYAFLRSPLAGNNGLDPENIRLLLNEDATYVNMRLVLFDFLKNATPDDIVYIYFAGRGSPDPPYWSNFYLLPYDAVAKSIGGSSFPIEDLRKALRLVTAVRTILFIDACHDDTRTISCTFRPTISKNNINTALLDPRFDSSTTHLVFTASGPEERSAAGAQWGGGHGVFTHYLLEGLAGAADANHDHVVDVQEMIDYTTSNVARATTGNQHPTVAKTAYNASLSMALVLPGVTIAPIRMDEIARFPRLQIEYGLQITPPWIAPDSLVLAPGTPDTLRVRLGTDDKQLIPPSALTWTTSDPTIATVSPDGVVTPVSSGTATITASRGATNVKVLVRVLSRSRD